MNEKAIKVPKVVTIIDSVGRIVKTTSPFDRYLGIYAVKVK